MRIDPVIQRELDLLPVPYTIKKSKDHYFAVIDGHKPICIAGNHDKTRWRLTKITVSSLKKIRKALDENAAT
jgi:hypothetical protein